MANLNNIKEGIYGDKTINLKTISNFLKESKSDEIREAYKIIVGDFYNHPEYSSIDKMIKEGYTKESASKALACTVIKKALETHSIYNKNTIRKIMRVIPDLEIMKNKGVEELLKIA